jgi:CheY-like chemotaxis protein
MSHYPAILYVEDDPRSRRVMHLLLTHEMGLKNVVIMETSNAFDRFILALDPVPDVIFLDIHMEPYNGFEMLAMLRKQPQFNNTPIVALTASVMNEEVQLLREAGFDGCLAKPLNADAFPKILERILKGEAVWSILG